MNNIIEQKDGSDTPIVPEPKEREPLYWINYIKYKPANFLQGFKLTNTSISS